MAAASPIDRRAARPRRRALLLRIGAVLAGVLPFVLLELVLALIGAGDAPRRSDPFAGFHAVRPLFVRDASGERLEIAAERQRYFSPQSLPARKPGGAFRIFCVGGSTVQGRPYSVATAFSTWLELALRAAAPERRWEVVNCGGISYASYRLAPIVDEVAQLEPDLIVLCTGHNEFLEDRTYAHVKRLPAIVAKPLALLARTRIYGVASTWFGGAGTEPDARPRLPAEVEARLDRDRGMEAYLRDPEWRSGVIAHFGDAVARMLVALRAARVPVLVLSPPRNLRDCPPFKSLFSDSTTPAQRAAIAELRARADALPLGDAGAVRLREEVVRIDAANAISLYELARAYESSERHDDARVMFERAADADVCPLRMLSSMREMLARAARRERARFVDLEAVLEPRSPSRSLGDEWLLDHVHPSIRGHQRIALRIADEIERCGWLRPRAGWRDDAEAAFRAHLTALPPIYFARGDRELETLRRWSRR